MTTSRPAGARGARALAPQAAEEEEEEARQPQTVSIKVPEPAGGALWGCFGRGGPRDREVFFKQRTDPVSCTVTDVCPRRATRGFRPLPEPLNPLENIFCKVVVVF